MAEINHFPKYAKQASVHQAIEISSRNALGLGSHPETSTLVILEVVRYTPKSLALKLLTPHPNHHDRKVSQLDGRSHHTRHHRGSHEGFGGLG